MNMKREMTNVTADGGAKLVKPVEIKIYEKALCCESGVCGPSVDPELLRITTTVRGLNKRGFKVRRYNLSMSPMEFTKVPEVTEIMKNEGIETLPITLMDGKVVKKSGYPTAEEFTAWTGVDPSELSDDAGKVLTL